VRGAATCGSFPAPHAAPLTIPRRRAAHLLNDLDGHRDVVLCTAHGSSRMVTPTTRVVSPLPNLAYGRRWLSRMRCGRGGQS
jgi:hypothetical protein